MDFSYLENSNMCKRSFYHFPTSYGSPDTKAKYWFVVLKLLLLFFQGTQKKIVGADDLGSGESRVYKELQVCVHNYVKIC